MPDVVVPLGTSNIKQLIRNLKEFKRELKDDIKVDIEQKACALVAAEVQNNIGGIQDVDGNYLGATPGAVTVAVGLGYGHEVIWRGKQIAYIEFGTGAVGQGYPGVAMPAAGYHPDPTKKRWVYRDGKSGEVTVSRGLPFQAPMYNAARTARVAGVPKKVAGMVLKEAMTRAFTV